MRRLSTSQISKHFGHRKIVDDVSLTIDAGEVVAIFGPNGAGKTTLIKILATLLRPTSGRIHIEDIDVIVDYTKVRHLVGVVIHEHLVYPEFTPLENLRFFGQMYGVDNLDARCKTLLGEVGLSRFIHEPLHIFSRGMTQRFMIAKALLHNPLILLLDEPFSGLDTSARQFVMDRIAQEQEKGKAILITTHNTELGYHIGTRFHFMIDGTLEESTDKDDISEETLLQKYQDRLIDTGTN